MTDLVEPMSSFVVSSSLAGRRNEKVCAGPTCVLRYGHVLNSHASGQTTRCSSAKTLQWESSSYKGQIRGRNWQVEWLLFCPRSCMESH